MTDTQARARVWTLCLAALVLCALTGPVVALLTPLAHASAPALPILAAILVGAYVALAVLLISPSYASCGPVWTATVSPRGDVVRGVPAILGQGGGHDGRRGEERTGWRG